MGGWRSPQVLLDVYAHFLPSELHGFADALTHPRGTGTPTEAEALGVARRIRQRLRALPW